MVHHLLAFFPLHFLLTVFGFSFLPLFLSFFLALSILITFLHPHTLFYLTESETLKCQSLLSVTLLHFLSALLASTTPFSHPHLPSELPLLAQGNAASCVSPPWARWPFYLLIPPSSIALARRSALPLHQVPRLRPLSNKSSLVLLPLCTLEWTLSSPPVRPPPMCTSAWVAPIGLHPWRKKPPFTRRAHRPKPKPTRVFIGLQG